MSKRIVIHCADQINSSGPLSPDDLAPAVLAAGLTKSGNPAAAVRTALRQSPVMVQLPDGRFDSVRRMLDGAALTHRVRYPTKGRQVLYAGPELAMLDLLLVHEGSLALRRVMVSRRPSVSSEAGAVHPIGSPTSALTPYSHSASRNGRLSVETVPDEPSLSSPAAERLRVVLRRYLRSDDGLSQWQSQHTLGTLMLRALTEIPDLLLDPLPPLDELLQLGSQRWGRDWLVASIEGPEVDPHITPRPDLSGEADVDEHASPDRDHGVGHRAGHLVVLEDLPAPLVSALQRDARNLGVSLGELTILLLSAATYRTAMPCRHDAEEAWFSAPPSTRPLAAGLLEPSNQ